MYSFCVFILYLIYNFEIVSILDGCVVHYEKKYIINGQDYDHCDFLSLKDIVSLYVELQHLIIQLYMKISTVLIARIFVCPTIFFFSYM